MRKNTKRYDDEYCEPSEMLCNAVVYKAVSDYRASLSKLKRNISVLDKKRCEKMIADCELFFTSDIFNIYTGLCGKTLMNKVRSELGYDRK